MKLEAVTQQYNTPEHPIPNWLRPKYHIQPTHKLLLSLGLIPRHIEHRYYQLTKKQRLAYIRLTSQTWQQTIKEIMNKPHDPGGGTTPSKTTTPHTK